MNTLVFLAEEAAEVSKSITWQDVLVFIANNILTIVIFLSFFFEISKIKLNPITSLMKLLSKPFRSEIDGMRKELKDDIDQVKTDLNENINTVKTELTKNIDEVKEKQKEQSGQINDLIQSNEQTEISRIRWEILEFSNSLTNGQKHVKDEYLHIKDDNNRYHQLIEKYNYTNGILDEEMEKINAHYDKNKNSTSVYF